jgi:hypothetical protein
VKFLVYTENAALLEKCLKRVYEKQINPGGHEIIEGVKLEEVINEVKKFLRMFNVYNKEEMYKIEEDIDKYNENTLTHIKEPMVYARKMEEMENLSDLIEEMEEEKNEKIEEINEIEGEIEKKEEELEEVTKKINEEIEEINEIEGEIEKKEEELEEVTKKINEEIKEKDKEIDEIAEEIKEVDQELIEYKEMLNKKIDKFRDKELHGILIRYGVNAVGVKSIKYEKLMKYLKTKIEEKENPYISDEDEEEDINDEKIEISEIERNIMIKNLEESNYNELKEMLGKYNIPTTGTVNELRIKIQDYLLTGNRDSNRRKNVYQYDMYGGYIKRWKTITELSEIMNMCKNFIARILNKNGTKANGFIWCNKMKKFSYKELEKINNEEKSTKRQLKKADYEEIKRRIKAGLFFQF